jgi:hypothetical protein
MICGTGINTGLRFNRKTATTNERRMFQSWWLEVTQLYGTYIDYYTYDYYTSAHNFFYGEHPLAPFSGPIGMVMLAQFNNDSLLLGKFGIQTDADATFIIPILSYRAAFNDNNAEPKAGDLIRMTELGWDRPGGMDDINTLVADTTSCSGIAANNPLLQLCADGIVDMEVDCNTDNQSYSGYDDPETFETLIRGAPVFEITERRDEDLTMNYNMLQGHYVWILHAKRFDYSYQPDAPREPGNDQVSDETIYGKLSGGTDFEESKKIYDQNIEEDSDHIWDYADHSDSNDSVYGNY